MEGMSIMRPLTCLLVVASYGMSAPDATPPPPPKGHALQIQIGGCDIDGIWRSEELSFVLERETVAEWLDHIQAVVEDGELEELDLDPHLTGHAEGITAPPLLTGDPPLQ